MLYSTPSLNVMMESLEHFARAEANAGESSAIPFEDSYFDGTTQVLVRGGCGYDG